MRRMNGCKLAAMLVLCGAAAAWGQDKPEDKKPEAKQVEVRVLVIRATTANKEISDELKGIADLLKRDSKYTGFKLEKSTIRKVEVGQAVTADLLEGYRAEVTPKERDAKGVKLTVEVSKGKDNKLRSTVTFEPGKTQIYGGSDWPVGKGDVLMIAVSAR